MKNLTTPQPNTPISWGTGTRLFKRFHSDKTTVGASIADHLRRDPSATVSIFGMEEKHVAALIQERQEEGKYLMDELGRVAPELSEFDYKKFMRTLRARVMS